MSEMQETKQDKTSYQFILIGDTHYDTDPEIYHRDYNEPDQRLNHIQRGEFARNAEMWSTRAPKLIKAASKQANEKTAFVMQIGDLIQGDCGNPEVHKKMLLDTLKYFRKDFNSLPFLSVTGNHDVRGTNAKKTYENTMIPYLSKELKKELKSLNFYFKHGPDLYLVLNFMDADISVMKEAFAKHANARYKFVFIHAPVLPADDGNCRWFLFGHQEKQRHEVLDLFLKNDVIVFAGHTHTLEFTEYVSAKGRISQLIANSVWLKDDLKIPEILCTNPDEYGQYQETKYHNPDGIQLLNEYKKFISRYYLANAAGYFTIDISDNGVNAFFFGGDAIKTTQTFKIR